MSRSLHIASVCRSLPSPTDSSAGIFVLNRLAGMAQQAQVAVLQPVPYFPLIATLPHWARQETRIVAGVTIEHAPMFYVPRVLKSLDAQWLQGSVAARLERMHRAQPLDAIDAHFGYPEGAGCIDVARRLGVPLFITIRGFEKEFVARRLVGPQLVAALRAATGVVAVSYSLKEFAVQQGVDATAIRVIHNAIDRQLFQPGDRAAARRMLGLDAAGPLVVAVGHLISRKRHHVLIDAFSRARSNLPGARLAIVGAESFEPDYPGELRARIAALGLTDSVMLCGNQAPDQVVHWLRAANAFALATAREGCCNAVLESLGTGCPVVTTPVGDNRHFVHDGENGFLVPVDDASAMADALVRALSESVWDPQAISAGLPVGSWYDVGREVLSFFAERIAAARQPKSAAKSTA